MAKGVYKHKPENYPPSRKGVRLTDEHRRKISESLKGNTWNRGRKHSKESSELKSKNSARYWLGTKRGKQSEETIAKRSQSLKGVKRPYMREIGRKSMKGKFGSEHPSWVKVKKHPLHKAIRETYKYREWRTAIFTRDNFTCVTCNISKVYVEADHYPIRFAEVLKKNQIKTMEQALACTELWEMEGRTLCKPCHLRHTFLKAEPLDKALKL